jgi:hypothetical protein
MTILMATGIRHTVMVMESLSRFSLASTLMMTTAAGVAESAEGIGINSVAGGYKAARSQSCWRRAHTKV